MTILMLLLGTAALAALGLAAHYASRHVLVAWYAVLAAELFGFAFGTQQQVMVGPLHLSLSDVVNIILLLAGCVRFYRTLTLSGTFRILVLLFLVLFAFSAVRGIVDAGAFAVSNESRSYVPALLAMLYFSAVPTDTEFLEKFVKAYIFFCVAIIGLAALHYMGLSVGSNTEEALQYGDERNRALPAGAAMSLAIGLIFSLGWLTHRKAPRWMRFAPVVFAGLALILQHRTVWVVLLVCSACMLLFDMRMARRLVPIAIVAGVLGVGVGVWIYGSQAETANELQTSTSDTGTLSWRFDTWRYLIFEDQTPMTVLVGKPIGTELLHYHAEAGGYEAVPPHSQYVELYARVGVVGLVIYALFLFRPMFGLVPLRVRRSPEIFPSASSWLLVLIGIVVYSATYSFQNCTIAFAGVATAVLVSHAHRQGEQQKGPSFAPSLTA